MSKVVVSLRSLPGILKRDAAAIEAAIAAAIHKTARAAVPIIKDNVPVAFGELRDSVHAEVEYGLSGSASPQGVISVKKTRRGKAKTVVDAPHAAAVEVGSMPHTPNFEELLRWVKLRGAQGLTSRGRLRSRFAKRDGPTTPQQARRVALMFKGLEVRGRRGVGRHSPIEAPEIIARRISKGIEEHGTKPHWYVRKSLPAIQGELHGQINNALAKIARGINTRGARGVMMSSGRIF